MPCRIEFHLDFEFTNKLIELAFWPHLQRAGVNMVQAFTTRAKGSTVSHKIAVEVVYALPEKQYLQRVTLEEGATVEAAYPSLAFWSFVAISIWQK